MIYRPLSLLVLVLVLVLASMPWAGGALAGTEVQKAATEDAASDTAIPAPTPAAGPKAVVERFHEALLAVMRDAEALGVQGRFDRLAPDIDAAFDLERMIRIAAGVYWKRADAADRSRLSNSFRRMSISTYASQFDGFDGHRFEILGERDGPQGTRLIESRIVVPDRVPVDLTYVLKESDDSSGWRIVDVLYDNSISQLAVRRSEYKQVLQSSGINGLLGILDGKSDQLLAGHKDFLTPSDQTRK